MNIYSVTMLVLALAVVLPIPAYLAYCHLNKKEIDSSLIQTLSFGLIIPAITLLSWDEYISSDVACAIFGAIGGFLFAKHSTRKS